MKVERIRNGRNGSESTVKVNNDQSFWIPINSVHLWRKYVLSDIADRIYLLIWSIVLSSHPPSVIDYGRKDLTPKSDTAENNDAALASSIDAYQSGAIPVLGFKKKVPGTGRFALNKKAAGGGGAAGSGANASVGASDAASGVSLVGTVGSGVDATGVAQ